MTLVPHGLVRLSTAVLVSDARIILLYICILHTYIHDISDEVGCSLQTSIVFYQHNNQQNLVPYRIQSTVEIVTP